MATAIDWNCVMDIAGKAARSIGQELLRYQVRRTTDEVRFYFGSGWYADIRGDALTQCDPFDDKPLRALMEREFAAQYEKHGRPIMESAIGHIVEAIESNYRDGATRGDLAIFIGARALVGLQKAWSDDATITAPLCPHGGSAATAHPRQAALIGETEFERCYRGEVMGVPILNDPWCPQDYWTVQRLKRDGLNILPCKLCGKPSEVFTLHGIKIMSCSCVEQIPGSPMMVAIHEPSPEAVERGKQAFADLWASEVDAAVDMPRCKGYRFEDERQTRDLVACLEQRGQEQRLNPDVLRLGYPLKHLTLTADEDARARAEWSRRLREKQTEARRKEREQVVVDLDWN